MNKYHIHEVEPGDSIKNSDISFEYVHVNHSIPMACGLLISTANTKLFHSGDFKLDEDPLTEKPYDASRMKAIGDEGLDVLLCDSTNAHRPGNCPGEKAVFKPLLDEVSKSDGATLITTFSSNLWRLQTVIEVCKTAGKKLYVMGGGMEQTVALGKAFGLIDVPESLMLTEASLTNCPRNKLVILLTGCQAEWRSALARMSKNENRQFKINSSDTIIFSSRIIPGNEKPIIDMIDDLKRLGANVVTTRENPGIHVSGHGHQGDITNLFNLLRPKSYLPIHGNFQQQSANFSTGVASHVPANMCQVMTAGDVMDIDGAQVTWVKNIEFNFKYVDSESYIPLKRETMRERHKVGEIGCVILTGAYARNERRWLVEPSIDFIGLELPDTIDTDKWFESRKNSLTKSVADLAKNQDNGEDFIVEETRISFRRSVYDVINKKPIVFNRIRILTT